MDGVQQFLEHSGLSREAVNFELYDYDSMELLHSITEKDWLRALSAEEIDMLPGHQITFKNALSTYHETDFTDWDQIQIAFLILASFLESVHLHHRNLSVLQEWFPNV